jgi:antitoxin CcdA
MRIIDMFSPQPTKKATNLSLSIDVLDAAKQLHINVSKVCDAYLREVVRLEQSRVWKEQHAEFMSAYNSTVEKEGLPLEKWRAF